MPPNTMDSSLNIESVSDMSKVGAMGSSSVNVSTEKYMLIMCQAFLTITGYILTGLVVTANLIFAFRFGPNLSTTNIHIVLCVLGYQLLMAVAILALTSESGFSPIITLKHKRWIHSVLQIAGSALAIAGSFVMSAAKAQNFDTLHGIFALVAMVFTIASLFNGVTSLYAYEWRKCLPGNLSKITHILFGILAFAMAAVSLCYGFNKTSFRNWATEEFTVALYILTGIYTAICILNPFVTFFSKINNVISK